MSSLDWYGQSPQATAGQPVFFANQPPPPPPGGHSSARPPAANGSGDVLEADFADLVGMSGVAKSAPLGAPAPQQLSSNTNANNGLYNNNKNNYSNVVSSSSNVHVNGRTLKDPPISSHPPAPPTGTASTPSGASAQKRPSPSTSTSSTSLFSKWFGGGSTGSTGSADERAGSSTGRADSKGKTFGQKEKMQREEVERSVAAALGAKEQMVASALKQKQKAAAEEGRLEFFFGI